MQDHRRSRKVQPNKIYNLPVHRLADSNDHTSRSLTCTVTTGPVVDDVFLAGDGHSSSNLVVKTARRICEGSRSSLVGVRGFVERLATDDALHRIAVSQSSCLRALNILIVNRPSFLLLPSLSKKSESCNHDDGVCLLYYVNEVGALCHRFLLSIVLRKLLTIWPYNINNIIQEQLEA